MLLLLVCRWPGLAQTVAFENLGIDIPDGQEGIADTRTLSGLNGRIGSVQVTLDISGRSGAAFNGDLYVYLVHDTGFAVLVNRPGRTAANPIGYGDNGLRITLDDRSTTPDLHTYRLALTGSHLLPVATAPVTGTFGSDGRRIDPGAVLDSDPRTATLASFQNLNPNGTWTLFVLDADAGGTARLNSWSLSFVLTQDNIVPTARNDTFTGTPGAVLSISGPGVLANDSDPDGDPLEAILATPPASGTVVLTAGGGFQYTPNNGFSGIDTFTYQATDRFGTSSVATVTLQLTQPNRPPVAVDDLYPVTEDTALALPAPGILSNDVDPDGDQLAAVVVSAPANGTLTLRPDGSLSYLPAPHFHGEDNFTYQASDGQLTTAPRQVRLLVSPVNDTPVANAQNLVVAEDFSIPIILTGTDIEGAPLQFVITAPPGRGQLLGIPPNLTYQPGTNSHGADSFRFKVNDGAAESAEAIVDITVTPVNDLPSSTPDAYATATDVPLSASSPGVLGNDTDIDGDPLTTTLVSAPANGTVVLNANGSFFYQPRAGFAGNDTFSYRAFDGTGYGAATVVALQVRAVNRSPETRPDAFTLLEDTSLTIVSPGIVANDSDPDANPLTAVLVSGPLHGTLALQPEGGFTYTPAPQFSGADAFTYRVEDGQASSGVASVTLTVLAVNDPPTAVTDGYSYPAGTTLALPAPGVLGNDTDPDSASLTVQLVSPPATGQLTLNADGAFQFTPAPGTLAPVSFTYRTFDGTAFSLATTVTLTPFVGNVPPTAVPDQLLLAEDQSLNLAAPGILVNDLSPSQRPLTAVLVSGPIHGTLSLLPTGALSYTPAANYNGSDSFTYRVNDGQNSSGPATVTLTITAVNDAPTAVGLNLSSIGGASVPVTLAGADVDHATLSFRIVLTPTHGSLTGTPPNLVYSPNPGFVGTDTLQYVASDGIADSQPATVILSVTPANQPPRIEVATSVEIAEDTALFLPVTVTDPESPADAIVFSAITLSPDLLPGLFLGGTGSNRTLGAIPGANRSGAGLLLVTATDPQGASVSVQIRVGVAPVNDPPVVVASVWTGEEDQPLGLTLAAGDEDGDRLSFVVVRPPSVGQLIGTAPALTYLPPADFHGEITFHVAASDGITTSSAAEIRLVLTPVNDPPRLDPIGPRVLVEDTPGIIPLTLRDPDGEDGLQVEASTDGSDLFPGSNLGVSGAGANRQLTLSPAPGRSGTASVRVRVTDPAGARVEELFVVTVLAENDPPFLSTPGNRRSNEDTLLLVDDLFVFDAEDPAADVSLTVASSNPALLGPEGIQRVPEGNRRLLRLSPRPNAHGTTTLTLTAMDSQGATSTSSFVWTVQPINDPPLAFSMDLLSRIDQPVALTLRGFDPEADPLSAEIVRPPSHGRLEKAGAAWVYQPAAGFAGSDTFLFRMNDGLLPSEPAAVVLRVIRPEEVGRMESAILTGAGVRQVQLRFRGVPSRPCLLQWTSDITGGSWVDLTESVTDGTGNVGFEESLNPGLPRRFYRLLLR